MMSSSSNNVNDYNNRLLSSQDEYTLYKPSKYLRMPRKLPLNSLHLQLIAAAAHQLKRPHQRRQQRWNKKEQRFTLTRLELFDQQFCLDQTRYFFYVKFILIKVHNITFG